jgi:hypothetical protein
MFGGAFPTSSRGRWAALGRQQGAVAEKAVPFSRAARRPDFVRSCFKAIVRVLPGAPAACVIVRKRRPTSGNRVTLAPVSSGQFVCAGQNVSGFLGR